MDLAAELTSLALGAGIGFFAGISPGPVLTLVVSETLRGGWRRGAADGPIIAVALLVITRVPPGFVPTISVIGGLFLLYLAVTIALNSRQARIPRGQPARASGGLLTGLLARPLAPTRTCSGSWSACR